MYSSRVLSLIGNYMVTIIKTPPILILIVLTATMCRITHDNNYRLIITTNVKIPTETDS